MSKCRAATVADAIEKMSTGSKHEMDKVIFCVGLNDLREGTEVKQIIKDMRSLIDETLYRHPQCYTYICSILPVNCPRVTRDKITRLNAELENLQNLWERVFYVNTMSAFMHHDTPSTLFESDHVHPNKKGVTVLTNTIRKKVECQQKSFHQFTSKPATPRTLSYARCASAVPMNKPPVTSFGVGRPMSTDKRNPGPPQVRQDNKQYGQTGLQWPLTGNPWRHGYGVYPHMMPPIPPQWLRTELYPPMSEIQQLNRLYGY